MECAYQRDQSSVDMFWNIVEFTVETFGLEPFDGLTSANVKNKKRDSVHQKETIGIWLLSGQTCRQSDCAMSVSHAKAVPPCGKQLPFRSARLPPVISRRAPGYHMLSLEIMDLHGSFFIPAKYYMMYIYIYMHSNLWIVHNHESYCAEPKNGKWEQGPVVLDKEIWLRMTWWVPERAKVANPRCFSREHTQL